MKYSVTIDNFEGPLDLLLHLIKENNIDIYDIKIEDITTQYLDYIRCMKNENLSVASEYLVMAAELLEMKSKMLLPKQKLEEDEEEEEDPKEVLIERLLNYKKFKEITEDFKKLEKDRKNFFTKNSENLNKYAKEIDNDENIGLDDLINAFNLLLKKKELDKPIETKITKKEISVTERVNKIRNILKDKKKINFDDLFEVSTKDEIIVSFLSILEMLKQDEILVKQDSNFNNITILLKEGE